MCIFKININVIFILYKEIIKNNFLNIKAQIPNKWTYNTSAISEHVLFFLSCYCYYYFYYLKYIILYKLEK